MNREIKKKSPRKSAWPTKQKKPEKKRFIVRKYVMAYSAAEAIRKEKHHTVDDVWIDDEWVKNNKEHESAIGFHTVKSLFED